MAQQITPIAAPITGAPNKTDIPSHVADVMTMSEIGIVAMAIPPGRIKFTTHIAATPLTHPLKAPSKNDLVTLGIELTFNAIPTRIWMT
jgi:hypothetical protein